MRSLSCTVLLLLALSLNALYTVEVSGRPLEAKTAAKNLQTPGLTLFTFHGLSPENGDSLREPILLHVLVKAKRRANGSIVVRTVSYPERVMVEEGGDFAPSPPTSVMLEFEGSRDSWQQLPLSMLGILAGSGPVIHEVTVPQLVASENFRIRVNDWPIYYNLDIVELVSQNQWGPMFQTSGTFRNAVVIGDLHGVNATVGAQLLATHMAHHFALGFDHYLVYVRGTALGKALQQNPVTARHLKAGSLQTISLDALAVPLYNSVTFAVYDASKLIAYNHAALVLWGERFHLAVLDIDEMWSSKDAGVTVNQWFDTCFPSTDIISATRVEVTCSACAAAGLTELEYFKQHWDATDPTQVLQSFSKIVTFHPDPKTVFDVEKVGQVWLHVPFPLSDSKSVTVKVDDQADEVAEDCVFVVHLANLFAQRIPDLLPDHRRHYLVHKHRTNSRQNRADDPISI